MSASEAAHDMPEEVVLLESSSKYVELANKIDDLEPLWSIAEDLHVSESQLSNWAARRDKNGFPQPSAQLGRFLLFDKIEVFAWYQLWQKVNSRRVAGSHLRNRKNGVKQ